MVVSGSIEFAYKYTRQPPSRPRVWSIKQQNTQYYAGGRNGGGRAGATHTYGARLMESRVEL